MAKKLKRKQFPSGFSASDFKYQGNPAKTQNEFGEDIGLADMACVDQFGSSNKAKYYHVGVVSAKGKWFVYSEWGRVFSGKSWAPHFRGQDFQFIECCSEVEARQHFQKKCKEKNTKRLEQKRIGDKTIWVGRNGKDGYVVQSLATREKGLPDAYLIKDSSGIVKESKPKKKKKAKRVSTNYQKQVVELASALAGGTREYARAASAATGVIPTLDSIKEVRDELLDAAISRISVVGNDFKKQINDKDLVDISNHVAALVPRPIPRYGTKEQRAQAVILSSENILQIQQDLDAFESSLQNKELFEEAENEVEGIDPYQIFKSDIEWIDPSTTKGRWIKSTFESMSNNRHYYLSNRKVKIKNIFEVRRERCDKHFVEAVKQIAKKNKSKNIKYKARLQPGKRSDLSDISDYADAANVFLGIHGTRGVNIQPILSSNLRLPKQLSGVTITGAAFGHGIYFATDWRKSYGYTGYRDSYYGSGGTVKDRGFFMFLNDVIMGEAYMAKRVGSWSSPPNSCDSVAAFSEIATVQNDEHIIFDPNYQRIRYIIEGDL